jgi:hypothetical protein
MATSDADLWHQVHAQREDGVAARFLIRDVEPRADQPQIFVIEMPYPVTDLSKLPDAAGHHRLDTFQDQWIEPACEALGWTFVAWKSEDGSSFFYLYGDGDPNTLLEKLAPFDGALGFFHDRDADWSEYAALRELVEQAEAADEEEDDHVHTDACEHDHDADTASQGISVIDLTAERPAGKARPAKARPAKARPAKARPAKLASRPTAKAKPAKLASRPTPKAKPAKPAARPTPKAKPAKPAARPTAKAKPAKPAARPTAKATPKPVKPSATRKTANRSGAKRAATSKPAARKAASPAARKPSKARAPRR